MACVLAGSPALASAAPASSAPASPPPSITLATALDPFAMRAEIWRDDILHVLAGSSFPARHANLFFHVKEAEWRAAVADLYARIPTLGDAQVLAGMVHLVAMIGDAHTMMGAWGAAGRYPVSFVWFDDGIFVVGAAARSSVASVGRKLVAIGAHPIADVIAAITPLVSRDNDVGVAAHVPDFLSDVALLAGIELAPITGATFVLADGAGKTRDLALIPGKAAAPVALPSVLPLHSARGPNTNYWNNYDADGRLLYFAYNAQVRKIRASPRVRQARRRDVRLRRSQLRSIASSSICVATKAATRA